MLSQHGTIQYLTANEQTKQIAPTIFQWNEVMDVLLGEQDLGSMTVRSLPQDDKGQRFVKKKQHVYVFWWSCAKCYE